MDSSIFVLFEAQMLFYTKGYWGKGTNPPAAEFVWYPFKSEPGPFRNQEHKKMQLLLIPVATAANCRVMSLGLVQLEASQPVWKNQESMGIHGKAKREKSTLVAPKQHS